MTTPIQQAVALSIPAVAALQQILQILVALPADKLREVQNYLLFLQSQQHQPPTERNGHSHAPEPSSYEILLTKQPNNGYLARPVLMPELVVTGADEGEALQRVREAIARQVEQSHIVRIAAPPGSQVDINPWLRFGGEWGDETEWEQFQADIETFRQSLNHPATHTGQE